MPTYFNYVEREADSYVNWADVGRDMSNTIDDIQRVREEKKALIEKTYREDLKFIQDNPTGEHENLRTWALNMGQSSAEMMRLQNTLLKQGKLSLNNYLSFRQNLTDSVEKIYTVNSQLQEAFKEVNDRTKAGDNQQLERETKVLLEKYGKLEDTEAYINPLNGTIYLGLTEIAEEDGKSVRKLKKGEGTYLSPDQLQAAAMQKFDKFDERPVLKEFVDGLGDVNEQIRQIGGEALAGKILSITDVTYERIMQIAESLPEDQKLTPAQMEQLKDYAKNFKEAETKYIDGILKNPFDASSLLTENIKGKDGKIYNIVFNKADQKTEYDIYVDKTDSKFTPVFDESTDIGKKQKEVLTNYLRGQLRVMYDRKVEQASIIEPQKQRVQPVYDPGARGAQAYQQKIKMYHKLFVGSPGEMNLALQNVKSSSAVDPSQTMYDANTKKLIITPKDPLAPPIIYDFKNPDPNVSMQDLVFSLLDLVDPVSNSKYGGEISKYNFGNVTPSTNMPYDDLIRESKDRYLGYLEKAKKYSVGSNESKYYKSKAVEEKRILDDLEKKQAAQRQGQSTGKAPRK